MGLETATYIDGLVPTNPLGTDGLAQGDDHIRMIKAVLKNTFPKLTGPVDLAQEDFIHRDGSVTMTGALNMGSKKVTNVADPSADADAVNLKTLRSLYPVGSLYFNASVATNPEELLGFGTWEAFGMGRVLLGVGSGTDSRNHTKAFSLGATAGEYEHVLTVNEMPAHNHTGSTSTNGNHTHSVTKEIWDEAGTQGVRAGREDTYNVNASFNVSAAGNHSHSLNINNRGGGQPHNNMQPYIAVHIWRRTA